MKKLKLSLANTQETEILSREQLKKIMGGDEGSGAGCDTNKVCGYDWDSENKDFTKQVKCASVPSLGTLPGGCFCLATRPKEGVSC